jgi:hypothetical protein
VVTGNTTTEQIRVGLAETDADAVGFYRRCGLAVTSLGERFAGIERFRCEWVARHQATAR